MAIKLLEVRLKSTYIGQNCENVFHYQADASTDDLCLDLAGIFNTDVVSEIADLLNVGVVFSEIYVLNRTNAAFSTTISTSEVGAVGTAATGMPRYTAYGFRFYTGDPNVLRGFKRFPGVDESVNSTGVYNGSLSAVIADLITAMTSILVGVEASYTPIIWRPANAAIDPTERLVPITGCVFKGITTQNTRKR